MSEGNGLPLAGIRVLDLGLAWAGPHASEDLAFLGADVVKVESERRLDLFRSIAGIETTPGFNEINLNKRSIRLDLRNPAAVDVARRLVAVADVLMDNFRPGVMERFGLSYDAVSAINPRVIMASISSFGSVGEESGYAGYASVFGAMGGVDDLTGYPDWEPALVRSPMDLTAANAAAALILAALVERQETGQGRFLDISATEVISTLIPLSLVELQKERKVLGRRGNESDSAFQGCYRCRGEEQWLAISAEDDVSVRTLGELIREDLKAGVLPEGVRAAIAGAEALDGLFAGLAAVRSRAEQARAAVSAWTSWQDPWTVAELLQAKGVQAHPTSGPPSEVAEEHLWMRGAITSVNHPVQGELVVLGAPWRQMGTPTGGRPPIRPGPLLGEHTQEVLREWLNMDDAEFQALDAQDAFK